MGSVHFPRLTGRRRAGPRPAACAASAWRSRCWPPWRWRAACTPPPRPPPGPRTAAPRRRCPAPCTRPTTTPAARASPTTSPPPTAPPTATARTGSTSRPPPTPQNNTGAGADDMGWTTAGQWFNYTVNVATAGTYTVAFRVASPYGIADALHIDNSSGHQPDRLGHDPQHRRLRDLDDGRRERHAAGRAADADGRPGLQRVELPLHGVHPQLGRRRQRARRRRATQPFGGTPAPVPGTVQAANYDTGGQGVAYNVTVGQRHAPTATAPTGSTWRPPPTRRTPARPAALTTSAGRTPGSGSSTPSRGHRRDVHGQLPGRLARTGSPTRCTSPTPPTPT